MNKTAQEMFERLGYQKDVIDCFITYKSEEVKQEITFDTENKVVFIGQGESHQEEGCLELNELKAIMQQMKELGGWLDE